MHSSPLSDRTPCAVTDSGHQPGCKTIDDSPPTVILVVDDNDDVRTLTTLQLRAAGFAVREAASGGEALALAAERPNLIILDVRLPDIHGFEVCQRLKANATTAAIPVLHISAEYRATTYKVQGLEGGADAYLTHPVEPEELLATVNALLRLHRAEAQLRESQERYRRLIDTLLEGIWILDAEGRTTYVNGHMATMLRYTAHEMLGRHFDEFGPATLKKRAAILERPRQGIAETLDVRFERKDHSHLSTLISMSPIFDGRDAFVGVLVLVTDLTERERAEEVERQAVALRSVAKLAAAAGHEINNPLMAIQGYLHLTLAEEPLSPKSRERLTRAMEGIRRIHEIIRRMARITRLELEDASANVPETLDLQKSSC